MAQSRNVAITGASSGIGEALVREWARRGANVALLARRRERLDELADRLGTQFPGQKFVTQALDVGELEAVLPALETVRDELGDLDTVVANAGITAVNRTGAGDFFRDEQVIRVNLLGAMATVDAAARIFRERGGGNVVGISSISAFKGIPGSAAYSASKSGFTGYLKTVGMEMRKHGVTVTAVHPGFINTELAKGMEKYPFVIAADKAARIIVDAVESGRKDLVVPAWPWKAMRWLAPLVPDRLMLSMFR